MSMSPVYAPADITRTNNNSSPVFPEFNSQTVAAAAAVATTKSFPNYFNNHISNGKCKRLVIYEIGHPML